MSIKTVLATLTLAVGLATAWAGVAEAGGSRTPAGWGETRDVNHHVYYPRYRHHYHIHPVTDPYAYRYSPRGYYPYYNAHYWAPTHVLAARKNCRLHGGSSWCYRYYASWGGPRRGYHHKSWHYRHHGRHHIGHW